MSFRLVAGNTGYIEIYNLVNALTPTVYINTATVTATIKDLSGVDIAGSIALAYVSASNGKYIGTIPHTVALVSGQYYNVRIIATSTDGLVFNRTQRIKAEAGALAADEDCSC